MKKRYQIFVSSTYQDLIPERNEVIKALLELDCIPSGMEYFPAADEDQWSYIKKLIEECDYYIVISAGKYGSIDNEGISFTQKEYQYAVQKKIPVIGFLHENINKLPHEKVESDKNLRKKLDTFHNIVKMKLCRFWSTPEDLGAVVSRSLTQEIKRNPRIGWVRADNQIIQNNAQEILGLRKKIDELNSEIEKYKISHNENIKQYASGDDIFSFNVDVWLYYGQHDTWARGSHQIDTLSVEMSWDSIFLNTAPKLLCEKRETYLKTILNNMPELRDHIQKRINPSVGKLNKKFENSDEEDNVFFDGDFKYKIIERDFQTIKIQLLALGLIELKKKLKEDKSPIVFIKLSDYGDKKLIELKAVKRKNV